MCKCQDGEPALFVVEYKNDKAIKYLTVKPGDVLTH